MIFKKLIKKKKDINHFVIEENKDIKNAIIKLNKYGNRIRRLEISRTKNNSNRRFYRSI